MGVSSDASLCTDVEYIDKFDWWYDWTTTKSSFKKAGCIDKPPSMEYVP